MIFIFGFLWPLSSLGTLPEVILLQKQYSVFLVDKNQRRLHVYQPTENGEPQWVLSTDADIGKNPGDKRRMNDHRTPEGIYFFLEKLAPPQIPFELYGQLAITMDYPNPFDQFMGKTGYGIWLHSVPDSVPLTRGSRGCVVIRNEHLGEVSKLISLGKSAVVIEPEWNRSVDIPREQHRQQVFAWLESWRSLWESQNLDRYLEFYHQKFLGNQTMNKEQWRAHKEKIKRKYTGVHIQIEPRLILAFRNQWVIRFFQDYRSDQYHDRGEKVLYVLKVGNNPMILREYWLAEDLQTTLTPSIQATSLEKQQ